MLTIGSLFSGIGGLELGLEWSGLGPTLWQVERDPWCRDVLARHWPDTERHEDVCAVGAEQLAPVDVICGGFPCQDVSSAGARKGLAGSRSGLWWEFARVVEAKRPEWVIVENVTSGAKLWVDAVRGELGRLGYETLPVPMQADWLGAPYPRARVFVVARRGRRGLADADRDGQPVQPQHAEVAGAPTTTRVACGARKVAPVNRWREPMPDVDRVVPGSPRRVAAQRAGGNCVVPQCAEVIGWIVREMMGCHPATQRRPTSPERIGTD